MLHGSLAACVAWRAVCCAQIGALLRRTTCSSHGTPSESHRPASVLPRPSQSSSASLRSAFPCLTLHHPCNAACNLQSAKTLELSGRYYIRMSHERSRQLPVFFRWPSLRAQPLANVRPAKPQIAPTAQYWQGIAAVSPSAALLVHPTDCNLQPFRELLGCENVSGLKPSAHGKSSPGSRFVSCSTSIGEVETNRISSIQNRKGLPFLPFPLRLSLPARHSSSQAR
jgi:hypothetical protein